MVLSASNAILASFGLNAFAFGCAIAQKLLCLFANGVDVLFRARGHVFPVEHLGLICVDTLR